jgi:type 1 glutamine amidotransferase
MITAQSPRPPILGSTRVGILAPLVLVFACSGTADPNDLNTMYGQGGSATAGSSTQGQAGSTAPGGGQPTGTAGSVAAAGTNPGAGTSSVPSGGTGGSGGGADTGGSSTVPMGGSAGSGVGGSSGGAAPTGPYAPRTGSFKMLVYSQNVTGGYKHPSIGDGQTMLKSIGTKQGFEVTVATDESEINAAGLAKYEIVFFMNSTGEIFSADQRKAYEEWIKKDGAYGGVHAAADTASSWTFYKEMTGQYYDLHDACCASADIRWTTQGENHVTVKGLPSPWTRAEEWYKFNKYSDWSTKAGFTILSTVTTTGGGTRPVSFVREWGNFRSFYTSLGHESSTFKDAQVTKHVTAGIMWAVRREALIKP